MEEKNATSIETLEYPSIQNMLPLYGLGFYSTRITSIDHPSHKYPYFSVYEWYSSDLSRTFGANSNSMLDISDHVLSSGWVGIQDLILYACVLECNIVDVRCVLNSYVSTCGNYMCTWELKCLEPSTIVSPSYEVDMI